MSRDAAELPSGYRLIRYPTLGSTNDEAKRLARAGAPAGTAIWGLEQTAGRGRRGRAWVSPPGNLYLSLILRPDGPPAGAAQLGFVAALALSDALDTVVAGRASLRCKWPNDLLLNGRKLAGILLESEMTGAEALSFVVMGVGVNIAAAPPNTELPATSLAAEGIAGIDPAHLLQAFVRHFDLWHRRWRAEGFAPLRAGWLARASGLGEPVRVRLDRATFEGRFLDLDDEGALLLEQAGGCRRVTAGEIFPAAAG